MSHTDVPTPYSQTPAGCVLDVMSTRDTSAPRTATNKEAEPRTKSIAPMPHTLTMRPEEAPESTGLLPLATLVRICWRGKWFLLLGMFLGLGYGLVCYLGEPPVYQSSTQILVVKKRQSDAMPVPRMDAFSYLEDYLSEHIVLIKSPLIIERAVQSGNLKSLKSFAGQDDPTNTIIGGLSITRDATTSPLQSNHILKLSYTGADADDCCTILNAVLESYRQFLEETYRSVGDDTVKLIAEARNVLQKDLARKAQEYQEFRQNAPLLPRGKDGITMHQETLTSLQSARSALLLRKAKVQGQLNALEKALRTGQSAEILISLLSEGDDKKTLASLQKELIPLMAQEQELLKKYGPGHPDVQTVHNKIEVIRDLAIRPGHAWSQGNKQLADGEYKSFIKSVVEGYVKSLRQELESITLEETSFADLSKSLEDEVRKLVNYEIHDETLKSDTRRTQQLYDSVLQRLNEVNLVKDMGGFNTQVVFPPEAGVQQPTRVTAKIVTAMCFGLLGGLVLASVANFFDKSFHSAEEIRRRLGVSVVGHIPLLPPAAKMPGVGAAGDNTLDPMLCAYHRPRSKQTEAFRGLRTALYFNTRGAGQKVYQITSPDVGDGKATTLAANLAASIAQSGKRVLLIDADFRLGRLHTVFGLSAARQRAMDVLAGAVEWRARNPGECRSTGLFVLAASGARHPTRRSCLLRRVSKSCSITYVPSTILCSSIRPPCWRLRTRRWWPRAWTALFLWCVYPGRTTGRMPNVPWKCCPHWERR